MRKNFVLMLAILSILNVACEKSNKPSKEEIYKAVKSSINNSQDYKIEVKAICYGNRVDDRYPVSTVSLIKNQRGEEYFLQDFIFYYITPNYGKPYWRGSYTEMRMPAIPKDTLNLNELYKKDNNLVPALQCPGNGWKRF